MSGHRLSWAFVALVLITGTAAADSVSGQSGQVNLAPGLCNGGNCTSYNPGNQTAPAGSTIAGQTFYTPVSTAGTQTVAGTDGGKLWTATVTGVTFQVFAPGAIGTTGLSFGYDGAHGYTIATSGGVIYGGCGTTGASVAVTFAATLVPDGTNWQCIPSAAGGGGAPGVPLGQRVASNSASLQWTGLPATYNTLILDCSGLVLSIGNTNVGLQVAELPGVTWKTTGYHYGGLVVGSDGSSSNVSSNAGTSMLLVESPSNVSPANPSSTFARIYNIGSATLAKAMSSAGILIDTINGNSYTLNIGGGYFADFNAVIGLQVIGAGGGTITSGQCSLYGVVP